LPLPPIQPSGVHTAILRPVQTGQTPGWRPITDTHPPSTNPPIIFEPFPPLSGNQYAVWMILTGGKEWGGCGIFLAFDPGGPYEAIGDAVAGGVQGLSTADFPIGTDPDVTNVLSVTIAQSLAQIVPAAQSDADLGLTLCWLDKEIIAYSQATLTAAFNYNLGTYIRRGLYGTTIADHPAGSFFGRILPATFRSRFPISWIGQTIYLKFPAFNTLTMRQEPLSTAVVYTYTITGVGVSPTGSPTACPVDIALAAGVCCMDWGVLGSPISSTCDWGVLGVGPSSLSVDMGVLGA